MFEAGKCPHGESERCHLASKGWPQDFECINGVAMDIDEWSEGFINDETRPLAPCHPGFCTSCSGTGYNKDTGDCPACNGEGNTLGQNDSIARLAAEIEACAEPDTTRPIEEVSDDIG